MGTDKPFHAGQLLNAARDEQLSLDRSFHAPERTFERETGCYNCHNYMDGEPAQKLYLECRARDKTVLLGRGVPEARVEAILKKQDGIMMPPRSGICLKGQSQPAAFVSSTYMCRMWSGRIKPEGRISDTPQELRDRLGETISEVDSER
jgi:hypothetical protein